MKPTKKIIALALLLTLMMQLTGCAMTVEEMYCLPRRSESYNNLQTAMDPVMVGLEYAAPSSGSNQQTAKGNVHVISEEGTEGYMPASPELGCTA